MKVDLKDLLEGYEPDSGWLWLCFPCSESKGAAYRMGEFVESIRFQFEGFVSVVRERSWHRISEVHDEGLLLWTAS